MPKLEFVEAGFVVGGRFELASHDLAFALMSLIVVHAHSRQDRAAAKLSAEIGSKSWKDRANAP